MFDNVDSSSVVAALGIISTGVLGFFGYRRSRTADKVAEKAGAIDQVINGLNILVDQLQDDNKILRESVKELRNALIETTEERDKLKKELKALNKKYGTAH